MKFEMRWIDALMDEFGEWYANETRHCCEFECNDDMETIAHTANEFLVKRGFTIPEGSVAPAGMDWEEDGDALVLKVIDTQEPRYVVNPVSL